MRWRQLVLAGAVLAALSACSADEEDTGGGPPPGESLAELRAQAAATLDRATRSAAPPTDAHGVHVESATVSASGTRVTVTFTGRQGPAAEPCGADYAAEAMESAEAVVVIVIEQRNTSAELCTMVGFARTATANLAAPLGDRPILELSSGDQVPLTRGLLPD